MLCPVNIFDMHGKAEIGYPTRAGWITDMENVKSKCRVDSQPAAGCELLG